MFPMLALSFQACGVAASYSEEQTIKHNKALKIITFNVKDKKTTSRNTKNTSFHQ